MSSFSAPVPITAHHDVSSFNCGKPPLDEFLQNHALSKQKAMLSRTYVVTLADSNRVVAYYTLAFVSITRDDAPKKIGRGMPNSIPALFLARLAVDHSCQGQQLGSSMFGDSLRRTWAVMSGSAPVRFFVVDAKDDEAREFYERKQMMPSPVNPYRLFLNYKDIEALFN